jgi:Uma2 family endonuclease
MNEAFDQLTRVGAMPYRISADEFWHMVDVGVFGGRRVELVKGELIEMASADIPHGAMAVKVGAKLYAAYPEADWLVCIDTYVTLDPGGVRAPDISVLRRDTAHPTHAAAADVLLAVEISHTTLAQDLEAKRLHYAEAGIPHYWVIDVEAQRLHRFARPEDGDYREVSVGGLGEAMELPGIGGVVLLV